MKLGLPFSELQPLYTKHLILKEFIITDVSLYIMSLIFQYKKQQAFTVFEQGGNNIALPLLEILEDRFINGIVLYRIAYCQKNMDKFKQAFDIFKTQKNLSPIELFYMACIYNEGRGIAKNREEATRLYKLAGEGGYIKAFISLGCMYRDEKKYDIAISYFKKALNIPLGKTHMAYMLELGYGEKDILRSHNLYIEAAKQGDEYAINRCIALNLI